MTDTPPPNPPIQAKKPDRPRAPVIVKPAVRIITASTTRNRLVSAPEASQDIAPEENLP